MKKILSLFLALTLTMGATFLASCGQTGDNSSVPPISSDSTPEVKTYTITFKQNNKVDIVKTVEEGADLTDIPTPAAKTGYTVAWDTSADALKNVTKNMTVTAVETPKTYTVTYDANGGEVTPETIEVTYDAAYTLATPTRAGYNFTGWTYNGNAVASATWNIDAAEITLVAGWSEIVKDTCTVTFRQDKQPDQVVTVNKGEAADVSGVNAPAPVTGYNVSWETVDLSNVTENIVVNVVATPKTYTVTLKAGANGAVTQTSYTFTYDKAYDLEGFAKANTGYKFVIWKLGDTEIPTKGTWNFDETNIELTACFVGKTYTVTLNVNGGKLPENAKTTIEVTYGEAYTLPTPTSTSGDTFEGWYYDSTKIASSSTWIYDEDITLSAKWSDNDDGKWTNNY